MSDYIKDLEKRNEELQERVTQLETQRPKWFERNMMYNFGWQRDADNGLTHVAIAFIRQRGNEWQSAVGNTYIGNFKTIEEAKKAIENYVFT